MIGFLISAIVVIVLVVVFWLGVRAVGEEIVVTVAVCFIIFILFGLVINSVIKSEAEGPRYEKEPSHDNQ